MKSLANKLLALMALLICASFTVKAEPYLAIKTKLKCSACHVNPIGGGMRSSYGNVYGHTQLPAEVSDFTSAEIGKLNDFIGLGGNVRYNAEYSEDDAGNDSSTFRMDSAQLYISITPKNSPLSFYLDQQIAPGSAVNREAYVQYRFSGQHYLKAGKMYTPFGLRLEDDTAFVRQVTGFNFDSSDNGLELGLEYQSATVNVFVTNGTSAVANNDDNFLYGIRGEKLFSNFRLGATALVNTGDAADQQIYNLYGGIHWGDFTLLGEVDWLNNERVGLDDQEQLVGLLELNYEAAKGLNLKFTAEYFDPDRDIDENHETRYSVVAEYAPISNLQLRLGLRSSEGIPQQPNRSAERLFVQTHLYF